MPERALRLPIKGLDPKSVFARFKKQNARKGIKTDRRLFVRHSQKGLKKQNARKGIKTILSSAILRDNDPCNV